MQPFDDLIAEAEARPVAGWDFSWLGDRMTVEPLPWDFDAIVAEAAQESPDLLDLGTGGGEWLSSLSQRPARTVATEAWPQNVSVAEQRLRPLGIEVVQVEAARDNVDQEPHERTGLPFSDASFHLIVSRHESYVATEIARVLARGGHFLTQQLTAGSDQFAELLGVTRSEAPVFRLELAIAQLEAAGLQVLDRAEGLQLVTFADVGALAWYLKAIPWTLPDFTPALFESELHRLHESKDSLEARLYAFWLDAVYR
jgi:SAM-dependent methyltransferase